MIAAPLAGALTTPPALVRGAPSADASPTPSLSEIGHIETKSADGYAPAVIRTATRTNTPQFDVPQSVQTVTRRVLDDQGALQISDGLRNVSGVVPASDLQGFNISPIVRGFNANIYQDGLPLYSPNNGADPGGLINVERIEVSKGPPSLLYGGGIGAPLGGVINVVSKRPEAKAFTDVSLGAGSYGYAGLSFDVNRPLRSANDARVRVTGQFSDADSFVANVARQRAGVYPSFSTRLGAKTSLLVDGRFTSMRFTDYSGLPPAGTVAPANAPLPRNAFPGVRDQPVSTDENAMLSAFLERKLSDAAELHVDGRYYAGSIVQNTSFAYGPQTDPGSSVFPFATAILPATVHQLNLQPRVTIKGRTGAVEHVLTGGVEFDYTRERTQLAFKNVAGSQDLALAPTLAWQSPDTEYDNRDNVYVSSAAFVQDEAAFGRRLHVLAGARYTNLRMRDNDRAAGVDANSRISRATPRLGASYRLGSGVAVFADYGEGIQGVLGFQGARPGAGPRPQTARQFEQGVKFRSGTTLAATLAHFDLTRENVPTSANDPNNPFAQTQTGVTRVGGYEADLAWQPSSKLAVIANYATTNAAVAADAVLPTGSRLALVPRSAGRLSAQYRWNSRWRVGAGVTASARAAADAANTTFGDGYVVYDAQLGYDFANTRVGLTTRNLTGRRYFLAYPFLGPTLIPSDPATLALLITRRL